MSVLSISIAIPTYQRGRILLETLGYLLRQNMTAAEILVVDQTDEHDRDITEQLNKLHEEGFIRWLKMDRPSIPKAMNHALLHATFPVVLFLDDDIIPHEGLIAGHAANYDVANIWGVAGQVLQPGQSAVNFEDTASQTAPKIDIAFPFNSTKRLFIADCMAGNLSVRKGKALQIGGFDENFIGVAHKFESDFARRFVAAGGKIVFDPKAGIRHLRAQGGGTRKYGNHLTSLSPKHGVGDYYFALRQGWSYKNLLYIIKRPFREVRTKFHLRNPWWIPVKLTGEVLAIMLAFFLWLRGPRYINNSGSDQK